MVTDRLEDKVAEALGVNPDRVSIDWCDGYTVITITREHANTEEASSDGRLHQQPE